MTFETLVAEAAAEPVDGWNFSWLEGRATEQRPSWGYTAMVVSQLAKASAVLDVQTGGGEVFAEILGRAAARPAVLAATEGWPANLPLAERLLTPLGVDVREASLDGDLPFASDSFDLVVSGHPIAVGWAEIARVLKPGGTYLSQGVGVGTNRELTLQFMDEDTAPPPWGFGSTSTTDLAQAAGLSVVDYQHEALRVEFFDIGAVIFLLRKLVWTVPDFSVDRYRARLAELHERIQASGPLVSYSRRYLIEARKPVSTTPAP